MLHSSTSLSLYQLVIHSEISLALGVYLGAYLIFATTVPFLIVFPISSGIVSFSLSPKLHRLFGCFLIKRHHRAHQHVIINVWSLQTCSCSNKLLCSKSPNACQNLLLLSVYWSTHHLWSLVMNPISSASFSISSLKMLNILSSSLFWLLIHRQS